MAAPTKPSGSLPISKRDPASALPKETLPRARLQPRRGTPIAEALRTLFVTYRPRAMVGLALMASQAFFYNAIFFTYALVLTDFYGVPSERVGWYILPFALGNVLGPILLGRLFDTVGRRRMIFFTYLMSGLLLAITGYLFMRGVLSVETQTIAWMIVFFFASTAASSAYLTVSETFPLEMRALAIAIFYAIGTGIGGVAGPLIFGALIDTGSRVSVFGGYIFASLLMIGAAIDRAALLRQCRTQAAGTRRAAAGVSRLENTSAAPEITSSSASACRKRRSSSRP